MSTDNPTDLGLRAAQAIDDDPIDEIDGLVAPPSLASTAARAVQLGMIGVGLGLILAAVLFVLAGPG